MKFNHSALYRLIFKCSRCGKLRSVICSDSDEYKDSSLIEIVNHGICSKGRCDGHIDCLYGCTHPTFLLRIARTLLFPFQRRPIIGYCELVSKECLIDTHYVTEWPDISADEAIRIQAESIRKSGDIIGSTFKNRHKKMDNKPGQQVGDVIDYVD